MSQRKENATVDELNIYAETRNDKGEITVTPTGLSLNQTGKVAESNRGKTNPFERLGPPPKVTTKNREALRARLGKKTDGLNEREVQQKKNSNHMASKTNEETTRRRVMVGKIARKIVSEDNDDDDVRVETMSAGQVKETYMKRYPEAGSKIYDTLIRKSRPPDDKQHIEMSLQMMKQRDKSKDPVLRENLLILGAYHLKVYHNLRHGRR